MRRDDFTHRIYYTAPFPFRLLTGPRMRTVEEEALQRGGAGGGEGGKGGGKGCGLPVISLTLITVIDN